MKTKTQQPPPTTLNIPTFVTFTFRDKNRQQKEVLNHLNAIGESVGALGWVTIDQELIAREKRAQQKNQQIQRKGDGHIPGSGDWNPAPASLVVEMRNASMFYTNRIIREFKEQVRWCAERGGRGR